jgi:hypothetical protein
MVDIIQFLSLFLSIWYGFMNYARYQRGQTVERFDIVVMSMAIAAFIKITWLSG